MVARHNAQARPPAFRARAACGFVRQARSSRHARADRAPARRNRDSARSSVRHRRRAAQSPPAAATRPDRAHRRKGTTRGLTPPVVSSSAAARDSRNSNNVAPPNSAAMNSPSGFKRTPDLRKHAGQIVDRVQREHADGEIEALPRPARALRRSRVRRSSSCCAQGPRAAAISVHRSTTSPRAKRRFTADSLSARASTASRSKNPSPPIRDARARGGEGSCRDRTGGAELGSLR